MFKSKTNQQNIVIIITMFMSKTYLTTFHQHRLRHAYVTKYSTNYRRQLKFMAKLLNKVPQ